MKTFFFVVQFLLAAIVLALVARTADRRMRRWIPFFALLLAATACVFFAPRSWVGEDSFFWTVMLVFAGSMATPFIVFELSIRSQAEGFNLSRSGGPLSWRLVGEISGARVRLSPTIGHRGPPVDELDVALDFSSPTSPRVSAEHIDPLRAGEPAFLQNRLDGILGGDDGVHWRDLKRSETPPSWGEGWRFYESEPGAAERLLGKSQPPMPKDGLSLPAFPRLQAVGLRGGVLHCVYQGNVYGPEVVQDAVSRTKALAAQLPR